MIPVLLIEFAAMSAERFDALVARMFDRDSPWHLWGSPILLGPRKAHVYGLCRAAWKPVAIEVCHDRMTVLTPEPDARARIYNLVRQEIDPQARAWLGPDAYTTETQEGSPHEGR